ncbi:MAG: enolase C-terminal domain-like protein [Candidatus Aenigmatarchaeota archaeon]
MKIKDIKYSIISIPFNYSIQHARKSFSSTESVIIELHIDEYVGIGECCPREYVGGVSLNQAVNLLKELKKKLKGLRINSSKELLKISDKKLGKYPHLKAAFDIAFVDIYCKIKEMYLYEYLGGIKRKCIKYDAGVPLTSSEDTLNYVKRFYNHGVKRFKLKADKDIDNLEKKVKMIKDNYPDVEIKIDANSSWDITTLKKASNKLGKCEILLIEDPIDIKKYKVEEIKKIKKDVSIPLMADESLITYEDAKNFVENEIFEWFNLKLSKNGGIHSLLDIYTLANKSGVLLQFGAHYGECGIIESVRRQIGCCKLSFKFFEGANRILLTDDIVKEDLKLKDNLVADLSYISTYGLGINLKETIKWN